MNINSRTSKINFTGFTSGAIASFTGLRQAPTKVKVNAIGASECNVVRCGINLWDEEWEYGSINNSDGTNVTSSVRIRSKNYIEVKPNTSICVVNTNSVKIFIYKYGKDKSFLGMVDSLGLASGNQVIYIPSDCYYLRFRSNDNYAYSNNVSFNYPSTDTDYHAYTSNTYTIPTNEFIQIEQIIGVNNIFVDDENVVDGTVEVYYVTI